MNTNFTFPRHPAPVPRAAPPVAAASPTSPTSPSGNRESNALRASVLDVALELGIGNNSTVTNWMFNNSLEEEEEEELRSPSLAHDSTATSEESSSGRYPLTPPPSQAQPNFQSIQAKLFAGPHEGHIHFDEQVNNASFQPNPNDGTPFPEIPPARSLTTRGKLRKKRADGYESDGGYISDAGKNKKDKDGDKKEREKEAKMRAKEEKLQEKKEKEEERRRKKTIKAKKKDDKDGYATGYESDAASKSSKKAKGETGYETDSGYVSSASTKSKKGRFFGLKSKQSKPELRQEEVPPLPTVEKEKEPVVLPIASKFARTFDLAPSESLTSLVSKALDESSPSPLPTAHSNFLPTPATTPLHPSSPANFSPDHNRESLSSAESGSSLPPSSASSHSHSKRRGVQFLGQDLGLGHGGGSGSYSTITPASQVPLPPSSVNTPVSATQAFPPISLPNTHRSSRDYGMAEKNGGSSPSQHSPSFSLNSPPSAFPPVHHSSSNSLNSPPSAFTPQVFPTARNPSLSRGKAPGVPAATPSPTPEVAPSPQPVTAPSPPPVRSSPTATTQPLRISPSLQKLRVSPTTAQPPLLSPNNAVPPSRMSPITPTEPSRPSPTPTTQPLRARPRNPPTDGFGPRPSLTPSPIPPSSVSYLRAPSPAQRPNLTIVPSSDYIVPSPRVSPLPSPNVLAYYDLPPPSPPPSGPLPKVPPPGSFSPRSRTQERAGGGSQGSIARSRTPEAGLFNQPIPSIQRGREAPFPARPILPQTSPSTAAGVGPGLEAAVKVPRYRELYGLPLPREKNNEVVERREIDRMRDWERERDSRGVNNGSHVSNGSDDSWNAVSANVVEDEEDDMRDVLERFEEPQDDEEIGNQMMGREALGRSRSFEAIRNRLTHNYDGDSDFEDDKDEAVRDSLAEDPNDTNSHWSMSIYSRASVLDPEKSEEARQRFIKRVEDLYGSDGREKDDIVPPVPKIPDAFMDAPGRSWNRF